MFGAAVGDIATAGGGTDHPMFPQELIFLNVDRPHCGGVAKTEATDTCQLGLGGIRLVANPHQLICAQFLVRLRDEIEVFVFPLREENPPTLASSMAFLVAMAEVLASITS